MSLLDSARVLGAMARVTAPTLVEALRGALTRDAVDERTRWFGRRVVDRQLAGEEMRLAGVVNAPEVLSRPVLAGVVGEHARARQRDRLDAGALEQLAPLVGRILVGGVHRLLVDAHRFGAERADRGFRQ